MSVDFADHRVIEPVYEVPEAAEILRVSPAFLRKQLRENRIAGYKPAGRWLMLESQIVAAQQKFSTEPVPVVGARPSGLSRKSRFVRRTAGVSA